MKNYKATTIILAAIFSLATAQTAAALTESQTASLKGAIQATAPIELAAKAMELVGQSKKADRVETAVAVVQAAAAKSSASLGSVVSALVTMEAELAPQVVAAAIQAAPDQAELLARLIVVAAPSQSDEVVAEVAKSNPAVASKVAQVVGKALVESSASSAASTRSATRGTRSFATSGGTLTQTQLPIAPRSYAGGFFPQQSPQNVSNYAAPGSDPNRQ